MDLPAPLRALRSGRAPLLLELDLTGGLLDDVPSDPLSRLRAMRTPVLPTVLGKLRDAQSDPRVRGLVVKLGGDAMPLATAQELHAAVTAFRTAGKATTAWAESYGEFGRGTTAYLLATAFEQVWLQPSGDVGLTGVALEAVFLRAALDRLGVQPQLDRRYEYKNAADVFLQRGFTDAHREATERLAASLYGQVVDAVAAGRRLPGDAVGALVDRAPLIAADAQAGGLVDRIGYRDEVYTAARGDGERQLRFVHRYAPRYPLVQRVRRKVAARGRPIVALVSGRGEIKQGRNGRSLLTGSAMGSDTISAALRAAAADDRVAAVVFRVNSPGGSYVASDTIWREVGQVRAAGKPVVVSMGALAASGGYFVSCPADAIVALPGTLTGSIGVYGGKAVVTDLLGRLGVDTDAVTRGRHARMFSARAAYTEDEWAQLQHWLDRVYDDFVGKVAAGRGLSRERVHEIARGRVWTGADALEVGLVDELGGLPRAAELARERAGLPADAELRRYPHVPLPARLRPPASSDDAGAAAAAGRAELPGTLSQLVARLGLPPAGPLLLPPTALQ